MNSPSFEHLHAHVPNIEHGDEGNHSVELTSEEIFDLEKTLVDWIESTEERIDALNNSIDEGRAPNSMNARAEVEKLEEKLVIKNGILDKLLGKEKTGVDVT